MQQLDPSQDLVGLILVATMLGLRHGFDADHLAAIDGMTRFNAKDRPQLAQRTGFWFSVGHGAVVMVVAVAISLLASTWSAPAWVEPFGAWASIGVLLLLGVVNLNAVRQSDPNAKVTGVAWRTAFFVRLLKAPGRFPIMGVGALFAISFDTLSQAALMAVTGTALHSVAVSVLLAGSFAVGMIATDALNGLWVARLIQRTDRQAARASRIMCVSVACVSIGTALIGVCTRVSPLCSSWAELHETQFSLVIVAVMLGSFLVGVASSPSRRAAHGHPSWDAKPF
jgi:high-affinity nickel-transport protein